MAPTVSVIVPTFNGKDTLNLTIEALLSQSYPKHEYEIIIVDDGSTDGTSDFMREFPKIDYYMQANAGSYSARNLGIGKAKGTILAFTDADCIPDKSWLEQGVKAIVSGRYEILVGRIDFLLSSKISAVEAYDINFHMLQEYYCKILHSGATANILVNRNVIEKIGPFDTKLRSGGDMEFCRRAKEMQLTIGYGDSVIVYHPTRKTLKELLRKRLRVLNGVLQRFTNLQHRISMMFIRPLSKVHHRNWFRMKLDEMSLHLRVRFVFLYYCMELMRSYLILKRIIRDLVKI